MIRTLVDPDRITRENGPGNDAVFYRAASETLTMRIPVVVPEQPGNANVPRTAYWAKAGNILSRERREQLVWERGR